MNELRKVGSGNENVINSYYNFNFLSSLNEHPFQTKQRSTYKYFVNAGNNESIYSQILSKFNEAEYSPEDLKLFEVSYLNYAIVSRVGEQFKVTLLNENSELSLELPEKIETFKEFIPIEGSSLFGIYYSTKDSQKLLILNSNINKNHRGLATIDLDCKSEAHIEATNVNDHQVLLAV